MSISVYSSRKILVGSTFIWKSYTDSNSNNSMISYKNTGLGFPGKGTVLARFGTS